MSAMGGGGNLTTTSYVNTTTQTVTVSFPYPSQIWGIIPEPPKPQNWTFHKALLRGELEFWLEGLWIDIFWDSAVAIIWVNAGITLFSPLAYAHCWPLVFLPIPISVYIGLTVQKSLKKWSKRFLEGA